MVSNASLKDSHTRIKSFPWSSMCQSLVQKASKNLRRKHKKISDIKIITKRPRKYMVNQQLMILNRTSQCKVLTIMILSLRNRKTRTAVSTYKISRNSNIRRGKMIKFRILNRGGATKVTSSNTTKIQKTLPAC